MKDKNKGAFYGDPKLKESLLKQLQAHDIADEITKGIYWEKGKGCAIGCAMHMSNYQSIHLAFQKKYNVPFLIGILWDKLFERLENKLSKEFCIEFVEAIPVGADLSNIYYQFSIKLLSRVKKYAKKDTGEIINRIIDLFSKPEGITYKKLIILKKATVATDAVAVAATVAVAAVAVVDDAAATVAAAPVAVVDDAVGGVTVSAAVAVIAVDAATVAVADAIDAIDAAVVAVGGVEIQQQKNDLLELLRQAQ